MLFVCLFICLFCLLDDASLPLKLNLFGLGESAVVALLIFFLHITTLSGASERAVVDCRRLVDRSSLDRVGRARAQCWRSCASHKSFSIRCEVDDVLCTCACLCVTRARAPLTAGDSAGHVGRCWRDRDARAHSCLIVSLFSFSRVAQKILIRCRCCCSI